MAEHPVAEPAVDEPAAAPPDAPRRTGLLLWGVRSADGGDIRNGTWGPLGGLGLFAIGYLFFEGIIGISGERLPVPEWLLPAVMIAIGVVLLGRAMFERRESAPG